MARHDWTFAVILACASPALAGPDDWPRFRGPNGAGLSDAKTVPVQWTDKDYNWKVKLPGIGHGSPVVWGDRIYLMCADPETTERRIVCLKTADGAAAWRQDHPAEPTKKHRENGYASSTPAADGDGVVVTWSTPEQIVLQALTHDGKEMWRRELGPFVGPHGTATSPVIVDGLVVLSNEQEDYNLLYRLMGMKDKKGPVGVSFLIAVDRKTGETRWKVPRKSTLASYSTPCVRRLENGSAELIFTGTSHGITAIDPATGRVNWELPDLFDNRCVGSSVMASGLVVGSYGRGASGTLCVAVRPGSPDRKPSIAYAIKRSAPLIPTPLAVRNLLFLWSDGGIVTCLDAATGKPFWNERAGGNFYGSPVCVGDRIYCVSKQGEVVVLAASDTFKVLARVPLGEPSYSTPAVAGGVMYLRTATQLLSLGGRKP